MKILNAFFDEKCCQGIRNNLRLIKKLSIKKSPRRLSGASGKSSGKNYFINIIFLV